MDKETEEVSSYWGNGNDYDERNEVEEKDKAGGDLLSSQTENGVTSSYSSASESCGLTPLSSSSTPTEVYNNDDDNDSICDASSSSQITTFFEDIDDDHDHSGSNNGVIIGDVEKDDSSITSCTPPIKAINLSDIHQICSGQVIVTLSTAVKELLENSLDSGATSVEIRLVDYGSTLIEVVDNGCGVEQHNFQGLALKHHTSKISTFTDLGSLSTFGFRGEALSSLASLTAPPLTISTRAASSKTGTLLKYSSSGDLLSATPTPREKGTTVSLTRLFSPLPVRHAEFLKNLKREFHRMVGVVNAYCLIAKGVRIMVHHKTGNNSTSTFCPIVTIPSTTTLRERIVGVFGSKQLSSLVPFVQEDILEEELLLEFGLNSTTFINDCFTLEGFISKPNQGRSSADRQFFYINGRPCDLPKIAKIINQVYHTFSRSQCPFICLNISTSREGVDVNVTPDKRALFVHSEKSLCAIVKASVTSLYTLESFSFTLSQSQLQFSSQNETPASFSSSSNSSFATQLSTSRRSESSSNKKPSKSSSMSDFKERFSRSATTTFSSSSSRTSHTSSKASSSNGWIKPKPRSSAIKLETRSAKSVEIFKKEEDAEPRSPSRQNVAKARSSSPSSSSSDSEMTIVYDDQLPLYDPTFSSNLPSIQLHLNWEELKAKIRSKYASPISETDDEMNLYAQKFHAKINPTDNSEAEQELKKQLTKDMFPKMEILGQFNLGFILVKLHTDLFIVDQHASDEKYNFEQLHTTTVLQTQKLIHPMDLDLPAVSENIILDHLTTFRSNGFDFLINPTAEPTQRVKLIKIPYSKSSQFGKSDVEELIFMLEDCDEPYFCRPTKIRSMLASRACRKSVMIGKSLSLGEMKTILDHMGTMEQPWNCPHGRPTMRHMFNTNLLPDYKPPHSHSSSSSH